MAASRFAMALRGRPIRGKKESRTRSRGRSLSKGSSFSGHFVKTGFGPGTAGKSGVAPGSLARPLS